MLNTAVLFTLINLPALAEDQTGGIPWWVILLLLVIITMVVIWALTRSTTYSEQDAPHGAHGHEEHPAAEVHEEQLAAEVHEEPVIAERAPAEVVVIEPEPVEPVPPAALIPDDLKLIEGIGPKIASVLNAAGIQTFAQLAEMAPEAIRKILFDVDPRLARLGDPATWPAQAKLAAAGDMAGLQTLQESLKGGRKVD